MSDEKCGRIITDVQDRLARITAAGERYDDQVDAQYRRLRDAHYERQTGDPAKAADIALEVGAQIEELEQQLFGAAR